MKIGAGSVGYTPGSLYRRSRSIGYTPGSHYQRFGKLGLLQSRNMQTMNRQAVEGGVASVQNAGPQLFEARATESQGLSELAAMQVIKRVQEMAKSIAEQGEDVSRAAGDLRETEADADGDAGDGDDAPGSVLDETV